MSPTSAWPDVPALRVGLGCMRLSTDYDRDEERAYATVAAAVTAGITVFDTARSYGRGEHEPGHNEQLLSRALRTCGGDARALIVTKGGMTRPRGAWIADGRAKTIRADCEASLEALEGLTPDLYLLHAPDPRTPLRTSMRALARLVDLGLVPRIGICNVNRSQLDEALEHAPIAAVQVALSPFDDRALRGGVVERCDEAGIAVIAHSPLGGPRRVRGLERHEAVGEVARAHDATAAEVALAWLLGVSPRVVAIPGARRPETARSAARAASLVLSDADRERLSEQATLVVRQHKRRPPARSEGLVVLVMGIPGAGKSRVARTYVDRGFERLNRDERGGSLREVAEALDTTLASGVPRVVLDNTYLTRAARSHVVEVSLRHGLTTRCVWLDTPLAQAQVNLVERFLDRTGHLPTPEELKALARSEAGLMAPTSQMRALRELEPPDADEGFAAVERQPFVRSPHAVRTGTGVFVAASALATTGWQDAITLADPSAPHLVFDWRPDGADDDLQDAVAKLAAVVTGPVEGGVCPHGGGPPICWCRPPLPGLPLAFAHEHGIDPARSVLVGTSTAHRTLATTLGTSFVQI